MSITLSGGLPTNFVSEFTRDVEHVCQRDKALLETAVKTVPISSEAKSFDTFDEMDLVAKEGRNPPTPRNDVTTGRRWVESDPYHNAYQFDKDDDLQLLLDPAGETVQGLKNGRNRKVDDIILTAFEMTVKSGRRSNSSTVTWAGQNGNVKYTEASGGRTIPHDCAEGNCAAGDVGMTVEKAQLVLEYFQMNNCNMNEPIYGVVPPRVATQLFGQEEYANVDYNDAKPLAVGRMLKSWAGINWIQHTGITLGSSNDVDSDTDVYECWFWQPSGIILAVADSYTVSIRTRYDLSDAQEVYVHMNMGVMRRNEDKIVKVECQAG